MSRPAAEMLQNFYLRLRDRSTSADGTPITARQLESLVRLAEARARLDLREEITAEDAKVFQKFHNFCPFTVCGMILHLLLRLVIISKCMSSIYHQLNQFNDF